MKKNSKYGRNQMCIRDRCQFLAVVVTHILVEGVERRHDATVGLDSIVEKVIVGGYDSNGNKDPYMIVFVYKTGFKTVSYTHLLAVLLLAAMVTVSVALYALTQDITAVWYVLLFGVFVLFCSICFMGLVRRKLAMLSLIHIWTPKCGNWRMAPLQSWSA